MAPPSSAGIVLYRPASSATTADDSTRSAVDESAVEILLVHPGGPFWVGKDEHAWSIPKGEFDPDVEEAEPAARREFEEELGQPVPSGQAEPLPPFRAGRKMIHAWLIAGDLDVSTLRSNEFDLEWPPRSGRFISVPEVDDARWFALDLARAKLHKGQAPIVDLVVDALGRM